MNQQDALERLVVVSNRLPVVLSRKEGRLAIKKGTGGLITALAPIMRERGGVWVGWPGTVDLTHEEINELAAKFREESGFDLFPVLLSREEVSLYYEGFSNEVIWPLFHDLHFKCHFKPVYWEAYQRVNRRFSEQIVKTIQPQDFLWVHDYHFLLLAQELRKQGINQKLVFFLHIPFAPPDIFMKIPWRQEILSAVLEYDYLGFQTERDKLNFLNCVETLLPNVSIKSYGDYHICHTDHRDVHVGAYPISIDFHEFSDESASKEVAKAALQIHMLEDDRKLVFSVDRLDYTKGIIYRLEAIREFLKKYPEHHEKVIFHQVVVPSRSQISEYSDLKSEIDALVGEINSAYTMPGWVPIHYSYRSLSREELVAFYRSADVMLITPVKDGMNLVAKEFVAACIEENGVLVLSEFAGAAAQLGSQALLINPYHTVGVAEAVHRALMMPKEEKQQRMKILRELVHKEDIFAWIDSIISVAHQNKIVT